MPKEFRMFQMVRWEDLKLQIVGWIEETKLFRCLIIHGDGQDFRQGMWVYLEPQELKDV